MSQYKSKPDLGFNGHTLLGFLVSVFFIGVTPLIMFPARTGTAPLFSFLFFFVGTIFYVRGTRRFLFWTLQSAVWAFLIASFLVGAESTQKTKEIVESKGPISVQSLKENPPTGPFLLSGTSLDTQTAGSYRWCRRVMTGMDPKYNEPNYTERCTDVGVTALVAPGKESGESEIVGWVVQKDMLVALPKFFGDSAPFPLTTSSDRLFKGYNRLFKGYKSPVKEARHDAQLKWAKANVQKLGPEAYLNTPGGDAPFLYPVNIVVKNVPKTTIELTGIAIGIHAVFGWFVVLCLVLIRLPPILGGKFLSVQNLKRLFGKAFRERRSGKPKAPRERHSGRLKGPRKRD